MFNVKLTKTVPSGADVSISRDTNPGEDQYKRWLTSFLANNLNTTQALYSHSKILVAALNGPAVGLSAALLGFADFIYAAPHTYILTPFSSLGLITEGLASRSFVQRMGIAKANEALIMSKRITCEELVQTGFVNKVFETKPNEHEKFLGLVLEEVEARLGSHLVPDSMTKIKAIIRKPDREGLDAQSVAEVFGGLDRFMVRDFRCVLGPSADYHRLVFHKINSGRLPVVRRSISYERRIRVHTKVQTMRTVSCKPNTPKPKFYGILQVEYGVCFMMEVNAQARRWMLILVSHTSLHLDYLTSLRHTVQSPEPLEMTPNILLLLPLASSASVNASIVYHNAP